MCEGREPIRSKKQKLGDYILFSKGSCAQMWALELQQGCQELRKVQSQNATEGTETFVLHSSDAVRRFDSRQSRHSRCWTSNLNEELVSSPRPLLVPINLLQVPTVVNDLDEVMLSPRADTKIIKENQRISKIHEVRMKSMKDMKSKQTMASDGIRWHPIASDGIRWHPMAWLNGLVELLPAISYHCQITVIACCHLLSVSCFSLTAPFFSSLGSQNLTTLWDPVRQAGLCRWDFLELDCSAICATVPTFQPHVEVLQRLSMLGKERCKFSPYLRVSLLQHAWPWKRLLSCTHEIWGLLITNTSRAARAKIQIESWTFASLGGTVCGGLYRADPASFGSRPYGDPEAAFWQVCERNSNKNTWNYSTVIREKRDGKHAGL